MDTWLNEALEALADAGPEVLTIDKLCRRMNVSRGSFYWHFKGREDFVTKMTEYWYQLVTAAVAKIVELHEGNASERLLFLSQMLTSTDILRYDISIRSWASTNEQAAKAVKRADESRFKVTRALFAEIGFAGDQLEMRTRTFVAYYSMENALYKKEKKEERQRRVKLRHRMLTRRD